MAREIPPGVIEKVYDVPVVCPACSGAESFKGEVALVAV